MQKPVDPPPAVVNVIESKLAELEARPGRRNRDARKQRSETESMAREIPNPNRYFNRGILYRNAVGAATALAYIGRAPADAARPLVGVGRWPL